MLALASGTQSIVSISNTSNVNVPGLWIFQLDREESRGIYSHTKLHRLFALNNFTTHAGCAILEKASHTFRLGTLISLTILGLIMLLLILGALYGYCQVGKYVILTQRDKNIKSFEKGLQEKLISKKN